MEQAMTRLESLEKSIEELGEAELVEFARWFDDVRARRFDKAIEDDIANGSLNSLAEEALNEFGGRKDKSHARCLSV